MKKTNGNKVRLGIFVTATAALFIAAIYFVGERQQLFNKTFHVGGVFKDISGLQVGNNVRFAGINVGIIEAIEQITDSTVKVDMVINEHTRKFMKKNVKAIIGSDGLMGNKIVVIVPGKDSSIEIKDNDVIETNQPVNIDEILVGLKITAEHAADITKNLAVIIENVKDGKGTIGELIMDSVLAQNVQKALINIKQGAGGFKQNMDAAGHSVLLRGFIKKKDKEDQDKKSGK
jgi:phospholipid/cholesterol/gamma-HCH transport system substrate-binding protein